MMWWQIIFMLKRIKLLFEMVDEPTWKSPDDIPLWSEIRHAFGAGDVWTSN